MATAIEVEAATKAARVTLRPDDIGFDDAGWQVGRYAYATSNFAYNTGGSAALANVVNFVFEWVNVTGIAVIKKVNGFLVDGALNGTRVAGLCNMKMWRVYGLGPNIGTAASSNVNFPPPQGGGGLTGRSPTTVGTHGLMTNMPVSQARLEAGLAAAVSSTFPGYIDQQPLGIAQGSMINSAGNTNIFNVPLYDWGVAEQPLILVPGTGFQVTFSVPGVTGGTGETIMTFCNLQWDEWTMTSPGDK